MEKTELIIFLPLIMYLNDNIESHFRLDINSKKALSKLGLNKISDLLYYFPSRYTSISEFRHINTLKDGDQATIVGVISNLKTKKGFRSKIPMGQATITDLTGKINIVWFHQPYLAKMLKEGTTVRVTGKVSESKSYGLTLTNPEINKEDILPIDLNDSLFKQKEELGNHYGFPVYPESKGVSSKWIYHTIGKILKNEEVKNIEDYLNKDILEKYKLPSLYAALVWIHRPEKKEHAEIARKRFAFEEVFFIQLARQQERKKFDKLFSYKLTVKDNDIKDFVSRFPFAPTQAQENAIKTILEDLKKDKPMSRLVEGDVGSGKTFVAATVSYAVIKNRPVGQDFGNLQVAYMAPTEVLATQLFENFIKYFDHTGISIALITSSGCRKFPSKSAAWENGKQIRTWTSIARNQLLKWIKNGEIPIVIGTHSLISKSVEFEDLGLVIIDEQHRFGTNQRMKLAKKEGHSPHYLSMTATPIPRTLALTIYGDLDLSIIDQMPEGRKKVITEIVGENKRDEAYEKIKEELKQGRQLYVICPKIDEELDEEDKIKLDVKSVTSEAKRLKKEVFPEYNIEIMHSKMTKQMKEKVMKDFAEKKIDILVSTSVIEVGVNIPNATVIVIEGAERFGLAQLHQLRGRVIRSTHQSYCYLFANAKTDKTTDRLKALTKAANGFELAELDLSLRGAGLLGGDKQWGISDLGMEALKNIKMVEAARSEAISIIEKDIDLKSYPLLSNTLKSKNYKLHFE
ncbi:MAG TPA: ATP-dependent DNA helicase RecG [Candidatus Paceibacterota bacterium]|nr:ATP-dependent DNA helicase RecG [Candidatus Paceibacterota bacterium]